MSSDGVINDVRRPWLGPSLWAPLLLVLAACIGVVYYGHQVVLALEASVAASARAGGRATVNQIVGFIDREQERLRAFTEEKNEEIRRILNFPDDWPEIDALQTSVKRMFRGAFAFTVTGPDGAPLFEDFDGLVGPVCQASMRDFILARAAGDATFAVPPIHPVPGAYHFDLITPWRLDDGQTGLFFVSMSPARIAALLAAAADAVILYDPTDPVSGAHAAQFRGPGVTLAPLRFTGPAPATPSGGGEPWPDEPGTAAATTSKAMWFPGMPSRGFRLAVGPSAVRTMLWPEIVSAPISPAAMPYSKGRSGPLW